MLLDIYKAFHKVWLTGLILNSSSNDISGNPLNALTNFSKYRKLKEYEMVSTLLRKKSLQVLIYFGASFVVIYINKLSDSLLSNCKLFADNTSLFSAVRDATIISFELNNDF